MSDFKREARYYVIKIKDLTEDQDISLCDLLSGARIPCTDCVVVEGDWPNYEHTWATIQRVSDGTYDDPYAENERLRARVDELEAKAMQVGFDYSQAHILRKQAEAVECAVKLYTHKMTDEFRKVQVNLIRKGEGFMYPEGLKDYAQRLRQQAGEAERAGGDQ